LIAHRRSGIKSASFCKFEEEKNARRAHQPAGIWGIQPLLLLQFVRERAHSAAFYERTAVFANGCQFSDNKRGN
jgi:hypothetical protein